MPSLFGIPIEFILFALTLASVAIFHRSTMRAALLGLTSIVLYKIFFTGFKTGPGLVGFLTHLRLEWVILTNLFCLLTGFALLSRHFEESRLPALLPRFMPHDWKGAFLMLITVWVLSSFLDNIAAALIGGAMAHQFFRAKVHIGYLVAIVAAANAGGAWSVVGDTTTTMMWIDGVPPLLVFQVIIPSSIALCICGIPAAILQQKYSPILKPSHDPTHVDWARVGIVGLILVVALTTNMAVNLKFPHKADQFPFIGVAIWAAVLISVAIRRPDWKVLPEACKGSIFLLSLVLCASMMPVQKLPAASWLTALGLGFISSVFDNIPLTVLALEQGGYDWRLLAYSVGFGGSMIWFGSSAGVALSGLYPEAKSVLHWVRHSWLVALAFVVGFFVMLAVCQWHPIVQPVETLPLP